MDISGFNWILVGVIGVVVLALAIAYARLSSRSTPPSTIEDSEAATRRNYEEEERAHHGESDGVP